MKQRLERERKEAIKNRFASAMWGTSLTPSKILHAKDRLIQRNTDINPGILPRSATTGEEKLSMSAGYMLRKEKDPQQGLEKMIVRAVTLGAFQTDSKKAEAAPKTRNLYDNADLKDLDLPCDRLTGEGQRAFFRSQISGIVHQAKDDGRRAAKRVKRAGKAAWLADTPKSLEVASKSQSDQRQPNQKA